VIQRQGNLLQPQVLFGFAQGGNDVGQQVIEGGGTGPYFP